MDKILSIIIPTFNMEKYLHKCLDSLIVSGENLEKLDVLVINDGSKDSSSQIAHEYETKFPETFRVIDKENGNYGSCINRGLKEAMGRYIKVLDADDFYDKEVLNNYINYLKEIKDVDMIISDFCLVNEEGTITEEYTYSFDSQHVFSLDDISKEYVEWIWHHAITYRRELLVDMNYHQTEGISYTDDEWIFKPMFYVDKVRYYPQMLYYYLRGREGQTFDPKVIKKSLSQMIIVANSLIDSYYSISKSQEVNNNVYLKQKIIIKLYPLYGRFLLLYYPLECVDLMKNLDRNIEKKIPEFYDNMNNVVNRLGHHYIYNWRHSNYKPNKLDLIVYKFLRRVVRFWGRNPLHMPESLKRIS